MKKIIIINENGKQYTFTRLYLGDHRYIDRLTSLFIEKYTNCLRCNPLVFEDEKRLNRYIEENLKNSNLNYSIVDYDVNSNRIKR